MLTPKQADMVVYPTMVMPSHTYNVIPAPSADPSVKTLPAKPHGI